MYDHYPNHKLLPYYKLWSIIYTHVTMVYIYVNPFCHAFLWEKYKYDTLNTSG
jgi:hypothetical protein